MPAGQPTTIDLLVAHAEWLRQGRSGPKAAKVLGISAVVLAQRLRECGARRLVPASQLPAGCEAHNGHAAAQPAPRPCRPGAGCRPAAPARPPAARAKPTATKPSAPPAAQKPAAPPIDETWQQYHRQRSDALRNTLIEHYMPLVRHNATKIWARLPEGVELDDLISAGVFGLVDAIKSFDPGRGVKFTSYCVRRVRGAMLDELREMDWVPRLVRGKATRIKQAGEELDGRLGRPPTVEELARHLEMTVDDLESDLREISPVNLISLSKKLYETDSQKNVTEGDRLEDQRAHDPSRRMIGQDMLRRFTLGLNRNERLIFILYYWEELTMREIGQTLGLSESRVSQMHSEVIGRLRHKGIDAVMGERAAG